MTAIEKLRRALEAAAQAQRATADALEALAAGLDDETEQVSPAAARDAQQLLSVAEGAKRIGMSASWLYKAVEEGRLPVVRMGSRVRLSPADLDAFVADRRLAELG